MGDQRGGRGGRGEGVPRGYDGEVARGGSEGE